jgi:hypothetical protein
MAAFLSIGRLGLFFFVIFIHFTMISPSLSNAKEVLETDPFYQKLRKVWSDVHMNRNFEYWRAPERTPGLFLCDVPAAKDVWVSCNRWPDSSDARRFGLDAVRLSGAKTDHKKALAIYRWVRRWMIYNNKKGCSIEHLNLNVSGHFRVNQADKLLNGYGVHWCGGQARVVEQVWRALGYRAEKVIRGGHTIVGMHYRDYDGIERWHGLDVSHSAVAWHDSYQRLLSLDELSSQWYAFYYQYGLPGNGHLYFNDHRMELSFRRGETLKRLWGNVGKPYQDNAAQGKGMAQRVPASERGPYFPFTFGNGIWSYTPDLSQSGWEKGLAAPLVGMVKGRLQPADPNMPASAVWHFRTPYIISDAEMKARIFRKTIQEKIRLYLSSDNGGTWKKVWECPDTIMGEKEIVVPIGKKVEVSEKGPAPSAGFISPFGRYAYQLKLELVTAGQSGHCRVDAVSFENTVQLNLYALPQLQPGKNKISVRGVIERGEALRIIYVWDDPSGKNRHNETIVEHTPFTYEIIAGGNKWEDCVCKSITVEVVAATGQGNRTVVKEKPSKYKILETLFPVEQTMGRWNGQPLKKDLPKLKDVLASNRDLNRFKRIIRGAVMLADPRTFDAFKKLSYTETAQNIKLLAFVGMYRSNPERARSVLLDILKDKNGNRVVWGKGKDKKEKGWGREQSWCVGGTVIGYIAAEAQWKEFLPGLLEILVSKQCKPGWGPRYGTVRGIGRLGKGNGQAAEAIRNVLEHRYLKEHGDTLIAAAMAAGQIGDKKAIPALRKHLERNYWPLKHNAALSLSQLGDTSIRERMQEWLTIPFDENFRGYAAEALGNIGNQSSVKSLEAALVIEPFPWVRHKIQAALDRIETSLLSRKA